VCGIAGYTTFQSTGQNDAIIRSMVLAIQHRGPDAQGYHRDAGIVLGHARLSIIDLSEAGTQPFLSPDRRYALVFNGEIYNYRELRAELTRDGYTFKTQTDTEVVLALFILHGVSAVHRLNGMFAIAFWDKYLGTLDLVRDRIGKKPLYYATVKDSAGNDQLYFASELKALLAVPGFPRRIRPDAVYDYFAYQYVPDPKTIFLDAHKLEPGCRLHRAADGAYQQVRYWEPAFGETRPVSASQAQEELLSLLDTATRERMISDVPLGAFLSGGVDSSGIVALMARSGQKVTTCSIGFEQKAFNETEFAQAVADQYQTDHRVHTVSGNISERLVDICRTLDEPFADPSLVPTFLVSELARQDVTVALTGDGGDEVFAGYSKYTTDWHESRLRQRVPGFARSLMGDLAPHLRRLPGSALRKASSLLHSLSLDPAMAFYVTNTFLDEGIWQACISDEFRQALGDYHPSLLTKETYHACGSDDHLNRLLYTDMKTYLPGGILVKADRMSMANSLELRAPLLDYRVIEFANQLPANLKFNRGDKKIVLREALAPLLPRDILDRKKMGFSTPLADWFRGQLKPLSQYWLLEQPGGLAEWFRADVLARLWSQHQARSHDHSAFLWSALMFSLWWHNYMADDRQAKPQPLGAARVA